MSRHKKLQNFITAGFTVGQVIELPEGDMPEFVILADGTPMPVPSYLRKVKLKYRVLAVCEDALEVEPVEDL